LTLYNLQNSFKPTEAEWTVFPNPNNGIFTVQFPEVNKMGGRYSIIDISGQEVLSGEIINSNITNQIDASSLAKGIYIIRINNSKASFVKKLVICAN
jgi:Secretion system C-terminal sorting domain